MSYWDIKYKKTGAPVAVDNAPTTDGGANDPDTFTGSFGSFDTEDKHGADVSPELVIFAEGGTPTLQLYIWSKGATGTAVGKWLLLKDAIAPTPTAPATVKVPPYAKLFLRVSANGAGAVTAVYAGIQPT